MEAKAPQPSQNTPAAQGLALSRLWIGIGLAIIVLILVFVIIKALSGGDRKEEAVPTTVEESNPEAGVNPLTQERVEDKSKLDSIREYLQKVSPNNFKEEFMASVSNDTVAAYEQYATSKDKSTRLDAARLFHLTLNNSIVNRGDEKYVDFLADVQKDLESTIGQLLY